MYKRIGFKGTYFKISNSNVLDFLGFKHINTTFRDTLWTSEKSHVVLDKLEQRGYKVVAMTANKERIYWTLHKSHIFDAENNVSSSSTQQYSGNAVECRLYDRISDCNNDS